MRVFSALVLCLALAAAAQAEPMTIASFDDPAQDASTPLFEFDGITREITGGWDMPGLTLETITGTFEDVTFEMAPLFVDGFGEVEAGEIEFFDSGGSPIFTVGFDSAQLTIVGFGATEFLATNSVMFSGSILPDEVFAESFSFAFANQAEVPETNGFTTTAAFTSSAEVVPEPASVALLLLGGFGAWRRKRAA